MFVQDPAPLGSLGLSALVAVLPLATVLVLLGAVRMRAHHAALIGLLVALVVGVAAYGMPVVQAVSGALQGAAFGLWPIMWIVVNALWIYRLTVRTGHFDVLRRSFGRISDDPRIQALIIAFCFGALMEALAGFGAPVAISAVMLVAVGFHPVKAAVVALVANTAPVAFGAMGTPVVTLAQVTGLPLEQVSSIVGRQTPLLAMIVPLLLVIIVDGRRGFRDAWLPALVCGIAFGLVQFLASNYVSPQLADIGAALAGAAALVALPQTRRPVPEAVRIGTGGTATAEAAPEDSRGDVVKAYLPYAFIIVIFSLGQLPPIKSLLDKATWKFHWPGLDVAAPNGKPVSGNSFSLPFLNTGGTLVLLAGILTAALLAVSASGAAGEWLATVNELRFAILTVTGVLALAYVMNLSGQTTTIGTFIAAASAGLAFLSPVLGWFGVAVSGSDTSANALFGALQVTAAHQTGLPADLLAAANSSGGVLGKMVSPQNLTIACAAANLPGEEGKLLRKVLPWSVGLLLTMCLIVWGQSTAALSWMLP